MIKFSLKIGLVFLLEFFFMHSGVFWKDKL